MHRGIELPKPPPDSFIYQEQRFRKQLQKERIRDVRKYKHNASDEEDEFDDEEAFIAEENKLLSFEGDEEFFVPPEDSEEFTEYYLNKHLKEFSKGKGPYDPLSLRYRSHYTTLFPQSESQMLASVVQHASPFCAHNHKGTYPNLKKNKTLKLTQPSTSYHRHATDKTRFRAVAVTSDCKVMDELHYDAEDPTTPYQYVHCGVCGTRVGAFENDVYHFLNVIPGP